MPLRDAVEYVAAAYIVVFAIVLIYLTIMARRLRGVERDLSELSRLAEERIGTAEARLERENEVNGRGGEESPAQGSQDPSQLDLGRPESTVT